MKAVWPHLPILQVIIPLFGALLAGFLRRSGVAFALALAVSWIVAANAFALMWQVLSGGPISYHMGGWEPPVGIEYRVDILNGFVLVLVSVVGAVTMPFARRSVAFEIEDDRGAWFYCMYLLCLTGLLGIVITGDAFNAFVFLEISSLSTYVMIALGPDRRALLSSYQYLIMGTIGATFYLIGVGLIYMMTGTLNFSDMEFRIHAVADQRPILAAAGFITVGLALKAAIFPLHVWLPNAYTYAPHMVTAFLAACATKVSLYILLRFDFFVFQDNLAGHAFQFAAYLMPLAILGILVGSAVAMFEKNIKRLLAFSSIAQIGYMMLGASLVSVAGLTAGIVHIFNHALAKGTLFLAVALFATVAAGLRLDDLKGIARRMPWTFGAFVIAALSLIGIPGTAGFVSKWYLISAAMELGTAGLPLVAVILVSSLMAVVYVWRIVEAACFAEAADRPISPAGVPPLLVATLWLAAALNIYFGLFPDLPLTLSGDAAAELLDHLP